MSLPATFHAPDFTTLHGRELAALLNGQRDPLCSHLLLLIVTHSDFKSGWFLGSYARLQELSTPPAPERGARREGPTLKEIRSAIDRLIASGVLWRDASNLHNKQLRLRVWPRDVKAAAIELTGSFQGRAEKAQYQAFMRVPSPSKADSGQLSGQGYQQLNSFPLTPVDNSTCPQNSRAKTEAMKKIGELLGEMNRPPKGGEAKSASR